MPTQPTMVPALALVIALCNLCWGTASKTEGMKVFMNYWQNGNEECTSVPLEEFKSCAAEKKKDTRAVSQIFKSISCQCHVIPNKGGDRTPTRGYQVFRQCLLTTVRIKEERINVNQVIPDISLHQACEEGNLDVVKYIVEHNQDHIDNLDTTGQTPLMVAALSGEVDVFKFVLCYSNKRNMTNEERNNILHLSVMGGSVNIVKRVLSLHAVSIESKGQDGRTPVLMAASCGHREVLGLLVDEGCNVKAVDNSSNNVLHLACMSGNLDTVDYILSKEFVDIDSRGYMEQTPIMFAALKGQLHVFEILLKKGCNVQLVDTRDNNILHLACIKRKDRIVKYILWHGIISVETKGVRGRTPIMLSARSGCRKCFEMLLKNGSDLNAVDNFNNTILHCASEGGYVHMIKYVHSRGKVSLDVTRPSGVTLMMIAAWYGRMKAFDYLLSKGGDVQATENKGNNVLHIACMRGRVEMVKHLLKLNLVDPNQRNHQGMTPLQIAEKKVFTEIVRLFHH